jgi:hypothetical protein
MDGDASAAFVYANRGRVARVVLRKLDTIPKAPLVIRFRTAYLW